MLADKVKKEQEKTLTMANSAGGVGVLLSPDEGSDPPSPSRRKVDVGEHNRSDARRWLGKVANRMSVRIGRTSADNAAADAKVETFCRRAIE